MNTTPNTPVEGQKKETKKTGKRSYTFKQKLLPSVLISLAIPLTVCLFGPFDIYLANMDEFRYSLTDFMPLCALGALFFAGLFFAVLMLLKGRAYEIVSAILVSSTILMIAQRFLMNGNVDDLRGDGVGTYGVDIIPLIVNTVIWVLVIGGITAAAVILRKKHGEIVETVTVIAMITIIGMQAVSMVIFSVSSDVWVPIDERKQMSNEDAGTTDVLTFDGFSELSTKNNVVVFIVDRFDSSYYDKFVETNPEFFAELDGFTYFNDYTSLYSRTYPAVTSILTQKENDFTTTRLDYFKEAYSDGGPIKKLNQKGYNVSLYTKEYYAYENAAMMGSYVDNVTSVVGYYIDEYFLLSADMVRLSFSSYLPFIAKGAMGYMSTPDFNAHAKYILENKDGDDEILPYDSDLKAVKDYIDSHALEKVNDHGKFTFIHIDGCHTPIKYDENWNPSVTYDSDVAIKLNFEIIYAYLNQMKELGIYESSTIVITGDHAWSVNDYLLLGESVWDGDIEDEETKAEGEVEETETAKPEEGEKEENGDRGVRVTSMFFKRSGESGTPMATSTAQISQDELWNTIFESEGLLELKTGPSFYDIPEGEDRERRYFLQIDAKPEINKLTEDRIVVYKIIGSALDPENWVVDEQIPIGNMYK